MTEPTLFPESGLLRLRLDIAYDGTNFSGWGKQSDRRTVQEEIEGALEKLTRIPVETVVAGRTDAGVHALGQVVHVDIPDVENGPYAKKINWDYADLPYRLNRILSEDVRIVKASLAPNGFHARFSALRRHYRYKISDKNQIVLPLDRFDCATWYRPLDLDLLNDASALVLGEHDFAAFCKFREGGTTIRTLENFSWIRKRRKYIGRHNCGRCFLLFNGSQSCRGSCLCCRGKVFNRLVIKRVLDNRQRVSNSLVFPSRGLTFMQVIIRLNQSCSRELRELFAVEMKKRVNGPH